MTFGRGFNSRRVHQQNDKGHLRVAFVFVRIDDVVRARAVESVVAALGLAVATTLFAGSAILFAGRYPRTIVDFNVGVLRCS